jgi:hypothetical protein
MREMSAKQDVLIKLIAIQITANAEVRITFS